MIGLIDCNNFFVSCERVFHPELNNRPVVVLSNNDGCVIARSEEAKQLGIPMGIPLFKASPIIKAHNVIVRSSNYELYGDLSLRIMTLIAEHFPEQEIYSIDECFVMMPKLPWAEEEARALRKRILKGIGIPVSIGIAHTKTLAKIASKEAKKHIELGGVKVLTDETECKAILQQVPIGDVWGIGRRHTARLMVKGILNAYDFTQLRSEWVLKNMTIQGEQTRLELLGQRVIPLKRERPRASISHSRSLAIPLSEFDPLFSLIIHFADLCTTELRKQGLSATRCSLFIAPSRFDERYKGEARMIEIQFDNPTNSLSIIAPLLRSALTSIFKEGIPYKQCGIVYTHLVPEGTNTNLFVSHEVEQAANRLSKTIDTLRNQFGKNALMPASAVTNTLEKVTNHKNVSPRYSTRWDEILTVK